MANNAGEMPFLDHLEELRKRILLSLLAITIGFCLGWWLTTHFNLIQQVEAPIVPLVPGGKLTVTSATDPFMIVLKFSFIFGLVLASPFVIYQLWLFLSPALTPREKRAIVPSLAIGFMLFAAGAAIGWLYVVTPAFVWLLQFQAGTFTTLITYDSYMTLVVHLLVGMGISAELPLVMILLASLGIMSFRMYNKFRRYAVLASFVGGAILAPTPEVSMMILFTIPLLLLYEVGVAGAWIVERRKARSARIAAGLVLLALCLSPRGLHAQLPPPASQAPPGAADTSRRITGQGLQRPDSGMLKRLGLPSAPTHKWATADDLLQALLTREGFASTRFAGDSVHYLVTEEQIVLGGHAATLRDKDQLESDQILYDNPHCKVLATGEPRMFQNGQSPTIARTMQVDICTGTERGVMDEAFTSLGQNGVNWFMRGNLAVDSGGKRLFGKNTEFTSCDIPDPHYHFVAGEVKWMSQSMIVARPAVLYIRDVPVAWLPFIFQDTKRDRASGILIPRFGFNDIVRTNRTYNRTVSNVGYYWAPNDYIDATANLDWYANRYIQYTGHLNYRWLDRFVTGGITLSRQIQDNGDASTIIGWDHRQNFDVTTSLTFSLNYQSDSRVQLNNSVDPYASTANIASRGTFNKIFRWGTVSLGGNRSEALGTGVGTMTLPTLTISPKAVNLGQHVLWSPSFTLTNTTGFNNPISPVTDVISTGVADTLAEKSHNRTTRIDFATPFQLFSKFTFNNQIGYQDQQYVGRKVITELIPNPATNGRDSIRVERTQGGDFSTNLNWDTGINLPLIAQGTWNITPTLGVTNVTQGTLLVRSAASNGKWVSQGKKVQLSFSASPTWFGFINKGFASYSRFRYTLAPSMQLAWSPSAAVSADYAKAIGLTTTDAIPATTLGSIRLNQTFEGKVKPPASDTNTDPVYIASLPKMRLFSISSSQLSYDFQQAKLPHRTGWITSTLTNSFQSDLIPALTVSTTHSLWDGVVGTDSAKFSPFLSNVNASLQLTGPTIHALLRFLHLVRRDTTIARAGPIGATATPVSASSSYNALRAGTSVLQRSAPKGFTAALTLNVTRTRPNGTSALPVSTQPGGFGSGSDPFGTISVIPQPNPLDNKSLGIVMGFAPTAYWSVSWNAQYDITHGTFQSQQVVLQRDLHDWRASFTFSKAPTGNFALYFTVFLINLPDIKFDYNQSTLQQTPIQP